MDTKNRVCIPSIWRETPLLGSGVHSYHSFNFQYVRYGNSRVLASSLCHWTSSISSSLFSLSRCCWKNEFNLFYSVFSGSQQITIFLPNSCCLEVVHIFRDGSLRQVFSGECPLVGCCHLGTTHHWSICHRGVSSFWPLNGRMLGFFIPTLKRWFGNPIGCTKFTKSSPKKSPILCHCLWDLLIIARCL